MKRLLAIASLTLLLPTGSANAALISINDAVYGAGSITRDTTNGRDWLDLTFSTGYSVNEILGGGGGFLANGFSLATLTQVEAMYTSGGWDGVDNSGNTGSAAHIAFVTSQISLFGATGCSSSTNPCNEGWALTSVPNIVSRPFNVHNTSAGLARVACTTLGFTNNATPVNDFASCRMDYDQEYSFIGAYLVRESSDPAPVPEPSTLVLFGSGLAAAGVAARRRAKKQ